jgi:hypothetical protein
LATKFLHEVDDGDKAATQDLKAAEDLLAAVCKKWELIEIDDDKEEDADEVEKRKETRCAI